MNINQSSSAKNITLTPELLAIPFRASKYLICIAAFPLRISAVCLMSLADCTYAYAFSILDSKYKNLYLQAFFLSLPPREYLEAHYSK